MSFSQQVKKEIIGRPIAAPCCSMAAAYGIACFSRVFDKRGVVLHTERVYVAKWAKDVFEQAGIVGKIYVREKNAGNAYEFAVNDPYEVEKLLVSFGHTGEETALHIRPENFVCPDCFAHFVTAAFVYGGTVVDPKKGYTLEFISPRYGLLADLAMQLKHAGFALTQTQRKGVQVLYAKSGEQIEALLSLMRATDSAATIQGQREVGAVRNFANRLTNCETANIDKVVAATAQAVQDIELLEKSGVLQTLAEELQEAARLRRQHPTLSLQELTGLCAAPISKSGLSHRYRNLHQRAEAVRAHKAATVL